MQLPKELQLAGWPRVLGGDLASMKCSSRRNCNDSRRPAAPHAEWRLNEVQLPKELQPGRRVRLSPTWARLNEVQLPKELQLPLIEGRGLAVLASMKCSSRRNCNWLWPRLW